jgi:hypothetical protein
MLSTKIYDTVILGSGYFSLGYALTHENTLIIEDTQLVDPHFFGALQGFCGNAQRPASKGASALYDAFLGEGVIKGNRLAVNELEPAICRFIAGKNLNILLGTFCTDLKFNGEAYEIEICNNEGLSVVKAKRVIDTRLDGGNRMNLLVAVKDGKIPNITGVAPAFYDDQIIVELTFRENEDINRAKLEMLELEDKLNEVGARIVCASYRMFGDKHFEPYTDEMGVLHVDETAEGGIFEAYAKGEMWK